MLQSDRYLDGLEARGADVCAVHAGDLGLIEPHLGDNRSRDLGHQQVRREVDSAEYHANPLAASVCLPRIAMAEETRSESMYRFPSLSRICSRTDRMPARASSESPSGRAGV